ncbi:arginase family protein [Saccharicrinis aurantiacus]|uniref:arginase family protein n=1 Tax=Saccharicrinis aurantiacus TaxID=1849719 RepID=UPI0008392DEB|nr:arginase family protein [Saccharicrinis aurantiacus]
MNLTDYFNPVNIKSESQGALEYEDTLASQISSLNEGVDLVSFNLAILGIEDATNSPFNKGCSEAPNKIRKYLYGLARTSRSLNIIDLGNVKGNSIDDRYLALEEVCKRLLDVNIVVLFLGGSQDYLIPFTKILASKNKVTLSMIDNKVDYSFDENRFDTYSTISQLDRVLGFDRLNVNVIGAQRYFVGSAQEELFQEKKWSVHRLKDVSISRIDNTEPIFRDSQIICADASAIQSNFMPSMGSSSVNGFTGLDACKMMWYAGLGSQIKVCGLTECNTQVEDGLKGAMLYGQMVWHFIEGVAHNTWEVPSENSKNYKIYVLRLQEFEVDVRFYKSRLSDRWWCEHSNGHVSSVIACGEKDYQQAKKGRMPNCLSRYR